MVKTEETIYEDSKSNSVKQFIYQVWTVTTVLVSVFGSTLSFIEANFGKNEFQLSLYKESIIR